MVEIDLIYIIFKFTTLVALAYFKILSIQKVLQNKRENVKHQDNSCDEPRKFLPDPLYYIKDVYIIFVGSLFQSHCILYKQNFHKLPVVTNHN